MTSPERDPVAERLRRTMADAAAGRRPGPAPVEYILRAGHARRVRRRRVTVAAAACLMVCLAVPVARLTAAHNARTAVPVPPAVTASPSPSPLPARPLSARIGSGTVDGLRWSVTFEYYAKAPEGYQPHAGVPPHTPVLCERMYVGGVRVDRAGGDWSDCDYTAGENPASVGAYGSFLADGPHQNGYLVFLGKPVAGTTHTVVVLSDGRHLTARAVAVPGIGVRRYAFAYGPGESVVSRTDYDAANTPLRTVDGTAP